MLGGGTRQAGILAAAGLHALEHHVERLAQDHALAQRLAAGLQGLPGIVVEPAQTNMLFLQLPPAQASRFIDHLKQHGILVTGLYQMRMVTHLDVTAAQIERVIEVAHRFKPQD